MNLNSHQLSSYQLPTDSSATCKQMNDPIDTTSEQTNGQASTTSS